MTVNGTIHFNDEDDYQRYLDDPHWQNHEEGHIVQGEKGPATLFLLTYAVCAVAGWVEEILPGTPPSQGGPTGHDYNGLERDAEEYADIIDRL